MPNARPEDRTDSAASQSSTWGPRVKTALDEVRQQGQLNARWLRVLEGDKTSGLPKDSEFLKDTLNLHKQEDAPRALEALCELTCRLPRGGGQPAQGKKPPYRPQDLDALYLAYKKNTPSIVLNNSVARTVKTLHALLEAGITPAQVKQACAMSLVRDIGAQLTASLAAYGGSFFTFNTVLAKLMRDGADDAVQAAAPPLAHTVASLIVHRFIRAAEMGPGWTRAVAAGENGETLGAILTKPGFAKTVAQYWPFFGPLLCASVNLPDPANTKDKPEKTDRAASRVEFRRDWGFVATAFVALHRILAFDREHVWLDASTEPKRLAMLGAIDELTSVPKTAASLAKYVLVRPLAGLFGMVLVDAHPKINKASEWMYGIKDSKSELDAGVQSVGISGYLKHKGLSLKRAALLMLPMGLFNTARGFTNSVPGSSALINVANDALLIGVWGYAMGEQERSIAKDESLKKENAGRASRQMMALARRAKDVAPAANPS